EGCMDSFGRRRTEAVGNEQTFLHAIRAEPGDDIKRLVYADWLEERGDPRGEFIRVQCRLAHLAPGDLARQELFERERELLETYPGDWLEPLHKYVREFGAGWQFRRGLVSAGAIDPVVFTSELFELAPALEEVAFRDAGGNLSWIVDRPECASLTSL